MKRTQTLYLFTYLAFSAAASAMELFYPLHRAAQLEDLFGMHTYLLDRDPKEVDAPNLQGLTPLMIAVIFGKRLSVKDLVNLHKADITKTDPRGRTTLHYAASEGQGSALDRKKIALFLMKQGAPLDAQTIAGVTPLHQAVIEGQNWVAKTLMSFGANKSLADNTGKTALMHAEDRNNKKLMKEIVAAIEGKIIATKDQRDSSETAAHKKCLQVLRLDSAQRQLSFETISTKDSSETAAHKKCQQLMRLGAAQRLVAFETSFTDDAQEDESSDY